LDIDNTVVEIESELTKRSKVWKKVLNYGSPIYINDYIKLGGNIMKLKYFHNNDEILAMK